jgi:Dolichyl-phosphate-mannose-protein mannosyltransferase
VNALMPPTARQQYTPADQNRSCPPRQRRNHSWQRVMHPLTGICVLQTALSLSLIWCNTAFADEAQYLNSGQLEWAHWQHGGPFPPYLVNSFSGSPAIYPPLGALANSIGGLAGARILSLLFMLGATIVLYLMASRLFGRTTAVAATVIWAASEPVIRLAFATFDPLSVLLTTLSAWLIVQAGYRYRYIVFLFGAAAALALANATAYSGIVIDPMVIAFAFLVWLPRMRASRATLCTIWLIGIVALVFGLLITASGSWTGFSSTILNRSGSDHQSILLVLTDSWVYSGLIAVLAVVGVITAFSAERPQRAALLTLLGCAAFVVPAAQFNEQTAWSLDKHLAYGIIFAAVTAGYACSRLIRWLPGVGRLLMVICCLIALFYSAATSLESAWSIYHSWPNARSFINAFKPIAAQSHGLIDVSETGPENIAEYYTAQGQDWRRWSTALSLNPTNVPRSAWRSHYSAQLRSGNYGMIALFYATTFSSAPDLPGKVLLLPYQNGTSKQLLDLVGDNSGEPGLTELTLAVENDPDYSLVAEGPYDSANANGIYAIWQRKPQK